MQQGGGTASSGYFIDSVTALIDRIGEDKAPRALELRAAGIALLSVFQQWMLKRPSDEERVAKIRELFEYNRAVLDYLMGKAIDGRSGIRPVLKKP